MTNIYLEVRNTFIELQEWLKRVHFLGGVMQMKWENEEKVSVKLFG